MGGINSGRRMCLFADERTRPIAEESVILSMTDLARAGALEDGAGILRWENNSLSYWTRGNRLTLDYQTRGVPVRQDILIGKIPLWWKHGTSRPCFLCPKCEQQAYKLYLAFGKTHFACRRCTQMAYELQTVHYDSLAYRFLSGFKSERKDREKLATRPSLMKHNIMS